METMSDAMFDMSLTQLRRLQTTVILPRLPDNLPMEEPPVAFNENIHQLQDVLDKIKKRRYIHQRYLELESMKVFVDGLKQRALAEPEQFELFKLEHRLCVARDEVQYLMFWLDYANYVRQQTFH